MSGVNDANTSAAAAASENIEKRVPAGMVDVLDSQSSQRAADWPDLGRYRDANAALGARRPRVVFIGDSITECWPQADAALFAEDVLCRGISGQTSPQILLRFMADVVRLRPRIVHLMAGTNDLAGNTGPSTPADYQNNMLAMITLAKAHSLRMIIGSVPPMKYAPWFEALGDLRSRLADINIWLRALADEQGLIYADYHAVLAEPDGSMGAAYTDDGVHPTAAGYARMRPVALAALAAVEAQ